MHIVHGLCGSIQNLSRVTFLVIHVSHISMNLGVRYARRACTCITHARLIFSKILYLSYMNLVFDILYIFVQLLMSTTTFIQVVWLILTSIFLAVFYVFLKIVYSSYVLRFWLSLPVNSYFEEFYDFPFNNFGKKLTNLLLLF